MATPRDPSASHRRYGQVDASAPVAVKAVMAVYRFLASLKLAVITIASLAAVLAYGTWYESTRGTPAVQKYVYQSRGFAVLLAFLAANVFCAASIRYPWKRRQVGFVVTHVGLLLLIFGSWWGFHHSEEGFVGIPRGGSVDSLVVTQHPVIRVRPYDPEKGPEATEYELPFDGGPDDWPAGRVETISRPKDPFTLEVKAYFPSSEPRKVHEEAPEGGRPMLRLRPRIKPPGATDLVDVFADEADRWFEVPEGSLSRSLARKAGPAKFVFMYVDKPEMVADFLDPPGDPGLKGIARLRYQDRAGKPRVLDVRLDDAKVDAPIALPDSDLTATFVSADRSETGPGDIARMLGDTEVRIVKFQVKKGDGPNRLHAGFAAQPMVPAALPGRDGPAGEAPLLAISYFCPPLLGGGKGMAGNLGVVEVMGDKDGKAYARVFSRDESIPPSDTAPRPGVLKTPPGPVAIGEEITAFGGTPLKPVTLTYRVERYFPSGDVRDVFVPKELPANLRAEGEAAALLAMTVHGETSQFWVHRRSGLDRVDDAVSMGDHHYMIAYDYERKPLGFSIDLKNYKITYNPGTTQPKGYQSFVELTDASRKIAARPVEISMNEPLVHRKYSFYQSRFDPIIDARGRSTGDVKSVLMVGYDAGRPWKYAGSLLVVIGSFLQFYIAKTGILGGGKADDPKAAADRARTLLARKARPEPEPAARPAKAARNRKNKKDYDDAIL